MVFDKTEELDNKHGEYTDISFICLSMSCHTAYHILANTNNNIHIEH